MMALVVAASCSMLKVLLPPPSWISTCASETNPILPPTGRLKPLMTVPSVPVELAMLPSSLTYSRSFMPPLPSAQPLISNAPMIPLKVPVMEGSGRSSL